jgi:multiple sugar transport system ATP-binding protein
MEPHMAEVRLSSITKRFGDAEAVSALSLTIADGEFVVLLGPTGAGKTTTLRLVAGLEKPEEGEVFIGGHNVTALPPAARDIAFVFQQYSLYPHLSVYDNLAFPLRAPARRVREDAIAARVTEIADLLRIGDKLKSKATQLSGGQMQRVAIGRALVRKPSIYLMDEPLSSLDAKLRSDLRVELKRIQESLGATILYVTHDHMEAMTLANRIGVLNAGKLEQVGSPRQIYEQPVNIYVAGRLGSPGINLVPRHMFAEVDAPPQTETIGVRTEHLHIRKATNGAAKGTVTWIEHLGDQNHLHVDLGPRKLVSLDDPESGIGEGDKVTVDLVRPLFFDGRGVRIQ